MSFKLRTVAEDGGTGVAPGEVWQGETVDRRLALCEPQSIRGVFESLLPRNGKILEAGCGLGRWVIYLRNKGFDIRGVEISEAAVRMMRAYDPSLPVETGDILRLPYPDASFAACISLGVIEHFEEGPHPALQEARRILQPGGLLFVSVPYENLTRRIAHHPWRRCRNRREARRMRNPRHVFHEYRYSGRDMQRFLAETGFETIRTAPDDFTGGMNMGLYADWPSLQEPGKPWHLNRRGRCLAALLNAVSPWLACSGILCVGRAGTKYT